MRVIGLSVIAAAVGCTREPAQAECPQIGRGGLVVTELRGEQSDMADTGGIWVELYNASGEAIDLEGTRVRFRKKDGSSEVAVIVRRPLPVAAGAYVTLGLVNDDDTKPSHIDYGFAPDFHQDFLPAAAVDVEACGARVDLAQYDMLPKTGTYSLGIAPDVDQNDDPANWCVNPTPAGTPQQANPPCP